MTVTGTNAWLPKSYDHYHKHQALAVCEKNIFHLFLLTTNDNKMKCVYCGSLTCDVFFAARWFIIKFSVFWDTILVKSVFQWCSNLLQPSVCRRYWKPPTMVLCRSLSVHTTKWGTTRHLEDPHLWRQVCRQASAARSMATRILLVCTKR